MKFSELKPGDCYSYRRTDKNPNAARCYINVLSNNKRLRIIKCSTVINGICFVMYSCYKKGEDCIKVRKITTDFFKKQLNKSKDYLTGVPYEEITTHTCITETKESKQ
jgi:hypothetical protein